VINAVTISFAALLLQRENICFPLQKQSRKENRKDFLSNINE